VPEEAFYHAGTNREIDPRRIVIMHDEHGLVSGYLLTFPGMANPTYLTPNQVERRPYCEYCDTDNHVCPGCGEPVLHGKVACSDCKAVEIHPNEPLGEVMDTTQPGLYRDDIGSAQAMMYDGFNHDAIVAWIAASGAAGEATVYTDALSLTRILVVEIIGSGRLDLKPGDWAVKCSCPFRFHPCTGDVFAEKFTAVGEVPVHPSAGVNFSMVEGVRPAPQEAAETREPEPDRYEVTAQQVITDIQQRRELNIGHYGNEKPHNVLYRAYQDALELALYLREQVAIAEGVNDITSQGV
jgi:hypothetical protein